MAEAEHDFRDRSQTNADVANTYGAAAKIFRTLLQSAVLAIGAVLVIEGKASGGIIIASSILTARALAPVDQAIANWRSFAAASQSWKRLNEILKRLPDQSEPTPLPAPKRDLRVETISSGPPGSREILVNNVSFGVKAGSAVGIIGPSGSGKSSLVRAITGVWPLFRGSVRPGWRSPRTVERGQPAAPHRLPSAGCGALLRDDCTQYRPI